MNVALFAVTAAVLVGCLAARIIWTVIYIIKSRRYKERIPIKDAAPRHIVTGFTLFLFAVMLISTLYYLYKYSDWYDFTRSVEEHFRAAFYGLMILNLLIDVLFGTKIYITEDGILTQAAFYPKGGAKYLIEKSDTGTYILLFTKKAKNVSKAKEDFAFIVNSKDESGLIEIAEEYYGKFDGTAPKLKKQSYAKRNLVILACSTLIFTGGLSLWYAVTKPVVFVGDKILKTDWEYAIFDYLGFRDIMLGYEAEFYGELAERADEMYSYIDVTENLTSKDLTALKEMPNLKYLSVYGNDITDLTTVGELTQLEGFATGKSGRQMDNSIPTDYTPLKNLTNLKCFCGLGLNNLNDLAVFENADGLIYFELTAADIQSGLDVICEKENLAVLELFLCTAEDFSPIGKCGNLKSLSLSGTNVTDLGFLKNLTELENLDIDNIAAEDYSVLLELPSLKKLSKKNCDIPKEIMSELIRKGVKITQ